MHRVAAWYATRRYAMLSKLRDGSTARRLGAVCLILLLTACASAGTPQTSTGSTGASIDVTLNSFSLTPSAGSAPAGAVTFNVSNASTTDAHEFVVAQTDLAADQLPVGDDGTVDEGGVTVIDELEEMEPGGSGTLDTDLAAGHYVLFCNVPTHYQQGMHADFTVNP
jgi:uncharacterized cupredoxin-like copper-binding protein